MSTNPQLMKVISLIILVIYPNKKKDLLRDPLIEPDFKI